MENRACPMCRRTGAQLYTIGAPRLLRCRPCVAHIKAAIIRNGVPTSVDAARLRRCNEILSKEVSSGA